MSEEQTYAHNKPTSHTSPFNSFKFAMEMARDAQMTCTIVKVKKVKNKGEVKAIGTVAVQPLVQMVNGVKQTVDHDTVYNLPYLRMVGGKSAVIIDPKVGDIGIVVTADRDVSGVKQKKDKAPPGSSRKYNISDGFFLGAVIADQPQSWVQFKQNDSGPDTIICGVGSDPSSACEAVIANDHVQIKKKGSPSLHFTVNAAAGKLQMGMTPDIVPDPFPND